MMHTNARADHGELSATQSAETCAAANGTAMQATKTLFHQVAELPFEQAMLAGRDVNMRMRGFAKLAEET